ncbi:MAG: 2-oxo acid dehydrogenase subunit E2 [Syntrophomonadaceae bacterium]
MDKSENLIGNYKSSDIPLSRIPTIDVSEMGVRRHNIKALLEIDVTRARQLIGSYKRKTGNELSFTAWIIYCISQTTRIHGSVNSYINLRRRKCVTFEDIDVTVLVEKEVDGQKVPLPYVVRKTNEKTLQEISAEICQARTRNFNVGGDSQKKSSGWMSFFMRLPQPFRNLFWKRAGRDPFFPKKTMGTMAVTAVGMFGKVSGWVIPLTIFTSCFALGSIVKKPGVIDDRVEIREYLFMTVLFDHDVIDGAPAARFISDLVSSIESAYGLDDYA